MHTRDSFLGSKAAYVITLAESLTGSVGVRMGRQTNTTAG